MVAERYRFRFKSNKKKQKEVYLAPMKFGKKTVHSEVGSIAIYVGIIEH